MGLRSRTTAAIAAAVLAALFGTWVGAGLWARLELRRHEARWRYEVAAERQRVAALRLPVLFGEPLDENAADRYLTLLAAVERTLDTDADRRITAEIAEAAAAGPDRPIDAAVRAALAEHQAEVDGLREAVRCTRVDWHTRWEDAAETTVPPIPILAARELGTLATLAGHLRAKSGEPAEAFQRYLEVVRFGADMGSQGAVVQSLLGVALRGFGLTATGQLAVSTDRAPWGQLVDAMNRLEPSLAPEGGWGLHGERLALVPLVESLVRGDARRPAWLPDRSGWAYLARCWVGSRALAQADELLRTLERLPQNPDQAERVEAELTRRAERSLHPQVRLSLPSFPRVRWSHVHGLALFRLVRLSLWLEQQRQEQGRYPEDLDGVPFNVDDPFAKPWPGRLHYLRSEGAEGYRIWSLGIDRTDDRGDGASLMPSAKDIALERHGGHSG